MLTLSIAIQKGGSGKSTTAINLGAGLARAGRKVLLVDIDPQANLTQGLGFTGELKGSIYEVLSGEKPAGNVILSAHGLDLLPASIDLAAAEMELISRMNRESILKRVLAPLSDLYDICLIDCPPSLGILTLNALTASQAVLMPLQAEFFPVKGAALFARSIEEVKGSGLNPQLKLIGLVLTKYDPRKIMHRDVFDLLKTQFGDLVFQTTIRQNIALVEAAANGEPIFSYDPESNGSQDYKTLTDELLRHL